MVTTISIVLYAVAVVLAIVTGAASERRDKGPAGLGALIVLALFVVAAMLQIRG